MKPFWKSRTFWFNLIVFILSKVQELDPETTVASLAAGNLLLRYVTKTGITLR